MSPAKQIDAGAFSADALEFIRLLEKHEVQYVIVGGEAVIFHGYPRLTGDIDFFYSRTQENSVRLFQCLSEFWNGDVPGVGNAGEFMEEGLIVQFGRPPHRIDLLNAIDGVDFPEAWEDRLTVEITGAEELLRTSYLGIQTLLKNKKASGRAKDMDDIQHLE